VRQDRISGSDAIIQYWHVIPFIFFESSNQNTYFFAITCELASTNFCSVCLRETTSLLTSLLAPSAACFRARVAPSVRTRSFLCTALARLSRLLIPHSLVALPVTRQYSQSAALRPSRSSPRTLALVSALAFSHFPHIFTDHSHYRCISRGAACSGLFPLGSLGQSQPA
jgi:hypothetical protein